MNKIKLLFIFTILVGFLSAAIQVDLQKANARLTQLKAEIEKAEVEIKKQEPIVQELTEKKAAVRAKIDKIKEIEKKVRREMGEISYFVHTLADQEASYKATKSLLRVVELSQKVTMKKQEIFKERDEVQLKLDSEFDKLQKAKYLKEFNLGQIEKIEGSIKDTELKVDKVEKAMADVSTLESEINAILAE